MKWINRASQEPSQEDYEYILVIGACGKPHVAYFYYNCWNHTECCYSHGDHFPGEEIEFDRWMPFCKPKSKK